MLQGADGGGDRELRELRVRTWVDGDERGAWMWMEHAETRIGRMLSGIRRGHGEALLWRVRLGVLLGDIRDCLIERRRGLWEAWLARAESLGLTRRVARAAMRLGAAVGNRDGTINAATLRQMGLAPAGTGPIDPVDLPSMHKLETALGLREAAGRPPKLDGWTEEDPEEAEDIDPETGMGVRAVITSRVGTRAVERLAEALGADAEQVGDGGGDGGGDDWAEAVLPGFDGPEAADEGAEGVTRGGVICSTDRYQSEPVTELVTGPAGVMGKARGAGVVGEQMTLEALYPCAQRVHEAAAELMGCADEAGRRLAAARLVELCADLVSQAERVGGLN